MFFETSSLVVSGKTLDIWSISNDLVSDQELSSACWYLLFLNIKVFLRDLFFSSSISLSNSLIVSNCLLISSLCSFILNFELSISALLSHELSVKHRLVSVCFYMRVLLLALALAPSAFFSVCSILMYLFLVVVSNFSLIEISFLLKSLNFSLSSTLISSQLLLLLLLELLSFSFPGITNLN